MGLGEIVPGGDEGGSTDIMAILLCVLMVYCMYWMMVVGVLIEFMVFLVDKMKR